MVTLNAHSQAIKPPVSEPPSPSSTQEFPEEVFSSTKHMLEPLETNHDDSSAQHPLNSGKTVRFSPQASVRDTLSRHDMSLEECYNYWMQGHEFLAIRQRNEDIQESNQNDEEQEDLVQKMARLDVAVEKDRLLGMETGLNRDESSSLSIRHTAGEGDCFGQEDIYYSGIYEDDAFAGVYFD